MDKQQNISIFTTASLPWLTGTAVNPLFRAAYLAAADDQIKVTLVIPWLSLKDQHHVYPENTTFSSPLHQEKYVLDWLEQRISFTPQFDIRFYPGKFSVDKRSIIPLGDITEIIPNEDADIAVLEEPEHLTWYHHGKRWKKKFRLVIGVVHTNYLEYVRREKNASYAFLVKQYNSWVITIYCHRVIRLSGATQNFSRSVICNVHGVNPKFLEIGMKKNEQQQNGEPAFGKGAYYIGKMVWNKGYRELLTLLHDHQKELAGIEVDLYGSGEDSLEITKAANKFQELAIRVHPGRDHADPLFHDYKVLLNPSTTDVVCTTTAEALAMGKFVVCANHPSNEFFKQFPNCRMYDNAVEFVEATKKALSDEDPAPMHDDQRYELSWEAATERFLKAAQLDVVLPSNTAKKLKRTSSMLSLTTSFNVRGRLEDASALVHFMGTGLVGELPDEEQCRELGLDSGKREHKGKKGFWKALFVGALFMYIIHILSFGY